MSVTTTANMDEFDRRGFHHFTLAWSAGVAVPYERKCITKWRMVRTRPLARWAVLANVDASYELRQAIRAFWSSSPWRTSSGFLTAHYFCSLVLTTVPISSSATTYPSGRQRRSATASPFATMDVWIWVVFASLEVRASSESSWVHFVLDLPTGLSISPYIRKEADSVTSASMLIYPHGCTVGSTFFQVDAS